MKVHLTNDIPFEKEDGATTGTVTHPRIAFAFNPITVKVNVNKATSVSLVVKEADDSIMIIRETLLTKDQTNEVYFDLSAVARSIFDRTEFHKSPGSIEDKTLYKKLICKLYVGSTSDITFSIPVIWGAMQIGETYSQTKTLKMFRGYPFTVPFFFKNIIEGKEESGIIKNEIQVKKDGQRVFPETEIKEGKYNFFLDKEYVGNHKKFTFLIDNREEEGFLNSFDLWFDYTFTGLGQTSIVVDVDVLDTCDDKGYYLRWINSHGEYSYWLFRPQVESTQVENQSIEFDQYYTTVDFAANYHVGTNKPVGKKVKKSIQLYADFVDSADFDFLMGMVQSPVVDLYMGDDNWMSVNIQPATFPKGNVHLQDFSFIMELPQTQIQSL